VYCPETVETNRAITSPRTWKTKRDFELVNVDSDIAAEPAEIKVAQGADFPLAATKTELHKVITKLDDVKTDSLWARMPPEYLAGLKAFALQSGVPLAEYVRSMVHDHILQSGAAPRESGAAFRAFINAGKVWVIAYRVLLQPDSTCERPPRELLPRANS
jgi:hypothetical protein